ncbi:transposase [Streptomyces sp. NPDC050564]|uniref:transposase n=1 Tax=Streptomyces sp. NPDC050564 TaxID=3365631 RepID=UPI003795667E
MHQDGSVQEGYFVAELTGVNTREGWPERMRLIVRRVKPSRRHLKKLTTFEKETGWRYCVTATNISQMWGIPGSGHAQFLDVLHRSHAGVEDRVRTNKAMGPGNLPSASWEVNRGWMLAANLATDLDAWLRLLALHDIDDLADAEPDTLFRPLPPARRLADHARRHFLRIERTWPCAKAFTTCWHRLTALPAVT